MSIDYGKVISRYGKKGVEIARWVQKELAEQPQAEQPQAESAYMVVAELPATIPTGKQVLYNGTMWRGIVEGESSLPAGTPWPVKGYKEAHLLINGIESKTQIQIADVPFNSTGYNISTGLLDGISPFIFILIPPEGIENFDASMVLVKNFSFLDIGSNTVENCGVSATNDFGVFLVFNSSGDSDKNIEGFISVEIVLVPPTP